MKCGKCGGKMQRLELFTSVQDYCPCETAVPAPTQKQVATQEALHFIVVRRFPDWMRGRLMIDYTPELSSGYGVSIPTGYQLIAVPRSLCIAAATCDRWAVVDPDSPRIQWL